MYFGCEELKCKTKRLGEKETLLQVTKNCEIELALYYGLIYIKVHNVKPQASYLCYCFKSFGTVSSNGNKHGIRYF